MSAKILEAISKVMDGLASEGLSKGRSNTQQGYKFRGIDDVLNVLARKLVEAKLVIVPRYSDHSITQAGTTSKGGPIYRATVRGEFLLCHEGEAMPCVTYGEAFDSADKATNKAMSAAYKYMALQLFCIPTEGDNDADAVTHEVTATSPSTGAKKVDEKELVAGYVKSIGLAKSGEELAELADKLAKEPESVRKACRQAYKEKDAELAGM